MDFSQDHCQRDTSTLVSHLCYYFSLQDPHEEGEQQNFQIDFQHLQFQHPWWWHPPGERHSGVSNKTAVSGCACHPCVSVLLRSLWQKNPKASSSSAAAPQVSFLSPPPAPSLRLKLNSSLKILELKNKNSPKSNLKFRFDKLSHSAAVSLSTIMWNDIKLILWIAIIMKSFLNHDTFTGNNHSDSLMLFHLSLIFHVFQ